MVELRTEILKDRNNWMMRLAKLINGWGFRYLGKSHVDIHEDLKRLKKENSAFLFTGLHKSLWETTGILVALHFDRMQPPYIGMGDNLVKGRFFHNLAGKCGVFLIKRASNRRELLESAKMLKEYVVTFVAHGEDVMVFPEGTRKSILHSGGYGKFFPTSFDALLEYEKNKDEILAHYKSLTPHNTYIVPVNVDYSRIREDEEMVESYKGKPRTLHILDSLKMMKNIGHTYVTFGKPINVRDHLDKSRKDLSIFTRDKCLELVNILPINVVARGILDSIDGERILMDSVEVNIARAMKKLSHLQDRFRGFTLDDNPGDIVKRVARKYADRFRPENIDIKHLIFYQLYANFISHYFETGEPEESLAS
ncbi:MAG: hypothetical protein GY940_17325 [bacterium]|nr:hypothetical protein [bacterium]